MKILIRMTHVKVALQVFIKTHKAKQVASLVNQEPNSLDGDLAAAMLVEKENFKTVTDKVPAQLV